LGCLGSGRPDRVYGLRAFHRRVAQGGCPPRAPTDPDMRVSRIRLVGLWIRSEKYGVHDFDGG
jgi:hypothetical protein